MKTALRYSGEVGRPKGGETCVFFAVFKLVIFSNFQFGNFSGFFGILGFSFLHVDFAILPDDFFF